MQDPTINGKRIELIKNIGNLHHPVLTSNKEAQQYFDQGLALIYALNQEDAKRSFRAAAELDSNMAMAYWGIALSITGLGNVTDLSFEDRKAASEAIQKGLSLPASQKDKAFIKAFSKELSADSAADVVKLNTDYMNAMAALYQQYPDDADAGVLYAVSVLFLKEEKDKPWTERWNKQKQFTYECKKAVEILEEVLKKYPDNLGANHMYIHAVEGSMHPELALPAAKKLEMMHFDNVRMGHLLHMPSHIYLLIGDYADAIVADEKVFALKDTSLSKNLQDFIYWHSYGFMLYNYAMQGRYSDAIRENADLFDMILPHPKPWQLQFKNHINNIPFLVRMKKWDEIFGFLKNKPKPGPDIWNFEEPWAYGMACTYTGKTDEADSIVTDFALYKDSLFINASGNPYELDRATNLLALYTNTLKARIAVNKKNIGDVISFLRLAVTAEDSLSYGEPPPWMIPTRESLGAALFQQKSYEKAEHVFREELLKHPNNPRALFGLAKTLEAEGKKNEAAKINKKFKEQWKYADTQLSIEDL